MLLRVAIVCHCLLSMDYATEVVKCLADHGNSQSGLSLGGTSVSIISGEQGHDVCRDGGRLVDDLQILVILCSVLRVVRTLSVIYSVCIAIFFCCPRCFVNSRDVVNLYRN